WLAAVRARLPVMATPLQPQALQRAAQRAGARLVSLVHQMIRAIPLSILALACQVGMAIRTVARLKIWAKTAVLFRFLLNKSSRSRAAHVLTSRPRPNRSRL